jgi:integrase
LKPPITKGTFGEVLEAFERHCIERHKANDLADGTLVNYKYLIIWCHHVLGHFSATDPVNGIRPKLVQAALDTIMANPGKRFNVRAMLGALDMWAEPREMLPRSIIRGVKVKATEGGHTPWSDSQVAHGEQHAAPDISRIISLMAHLGQRGSDVVRMQLPHIEEMRHPLTGRMVRGINTTTKKVGLKLWVPFTEELNELIDRWRPEILARPAPWYLVTNQRSDTPGSPYTRAQLSWRWNKDRANNEALAPLRAAGLVLHGLRGTCVVRYRKAGASVPEICATIGMSAPMVERYCRFADRVDLAIAAVHRLSLSTNGERKLFAGEVPKN